MTHRLAIPTLLVASILAACDSPSGGSAGSGGVGGPAGHHPAVLFRSGTQVANLAASNNQLIELRVARGFRGEGNSGRR